MIVRNEFLRPTINFIDVALSEGIITRATLEAVRGFLTGIPIQAAYCPVCSDQFDARSGEVAQPTVVTKRSCGHWCCDRCVRHCAESECANDGCADCMALCEGHAEPHCHEHTIDKNYCENCAPAEIVRARARELAYIEE